MLASMAATLLLLLSSFGASGLAPAETMLRAGKLRAPEAPLKKRKKVRQATKALWSSPAEPVKALLLRRSWKRCRATSGPNSSPEEQALPLLPLLLVLPLLPLPASSVCMSCSEEQPACSSSSASRRRERLLLLLSELLEPAAAAAAAAAALRAAGKA
jgi:hypothetical protein